MYTSPYRLCIRFVLIQYETFLQAIDVKESEIDFNPDFICKILPKLDWLTLLKAAVSINKNDNLPKDLLPEYENDIDFLKKVHHILLEIDIINGELICPETGRKFPINNSIPNMLLNEDEV